MTGFIGTVGQSNNNSQLILDRVEDASTKTSKLLYLSTLFGTTVLSALKPNDAINNITLSANITTGIGIANAAIGRATENLGFWNVTPGVIDGLKVVTSHFARYFLITGLFVATFRPTDIATRNILLFNGMLHFFILAVLVCNQADLENLKNKKN
jgi:hypothetical protein